MCVVATNIRKIIDTRGLKQAIKDCYWRKVVGALVCGAELLPCVVVIEKGKCSALKELFKSTEENEQ